MTTQLIIRILTAGLLGGLIGLEREYRAKEAGFRTHFLVALGSALFMVLSQYGFKEVFAFYNECPGSTDIRLDPSRIASQVVSGIGFIGAGTIIFQKHVVKGLTTAAGLWVTAAIGMACGSGLYLIAASSTLFVLFCLEAMNMFMTRFGVKNVFVMFTSTSKDNISQVISQLRERKMEVVSYYMTSKEENNLPLYEVKMELRIKKNKKRDIIMEMLSQFDGVTIENLE